MEGAGFLVLAKTMRILLFILYLSAPALAGVTHSRTFPDTPKACEKGEVESAVASGCDRAGSVIPLEREREKEEMALAILASFPLLLGVFHLFLYFFSRGLRLPLWSGLFGMVLGIHGFHRLLFSGGEGWIPGESDFLACLASSFLLASFASMQTNRFARFVTVALAGFVLIPGILSLFIRIPFISWESGSFSLGILLASLVGFLAVPGMARKQSTRFFLYLSLLVLAFFSYRGFHSPERLLSRILFNGFGHFYIAALTLSLIQGLHRSELRIGQLNRRLQKRIDRKTRSLNATLERVESRDRIFQVELEIAGEILESVMPVLPASGDFYRIDGACLYRDRVGGDFYDLVHRKDGTIAVLMGDVNGRGIPAALIALMAKIVFKETIRKGDGPKNVFFLANRIFVESVSSREYMRSFLLFLRPDGRCLYASAGHPWALLFRKRTGEVEEWPVTGGLFIGALKNSVQSYEEKEEWLEPGDRLVIYSDGILEQYNASTGEVFGMERIKEAIRFTSGRDAGVAKKVLLEQWKEFCGGAEVLDDANLLILDYTGREMDFDPEFSRDRISP